MKQSFVLPSVLKKRAQQIKIEKSLPLHQARDEAAREFGCSNYKNFKNVWEAAQKTCPTIEVILKDISSEKKISKKIDLAISFIHKFKPSFHNQLDILKLFQNPDAIQAMCGKLNLMKDEIQSCLFKDFLTDEGKYEIQFRQPHFIAKEISLSDLTYEIREDMLYVDGNYDLKTEFEFELDPNDPISKDDRFNDRKLFGSFAIAIDRDKNLTIEHSDIGEEYDSGFQMASFR